MKRNRRLTSICSIRHEILKRIKNFEKLKELSVGNNVKNCQFITFESELYMTWGTKEYWMVISEDYSLNISYALMKYIICNKCVKSKLFYAGLKNNFDLTAIIKK